MGRKKKPEEERKSEVLKVRVTQKEKEEVVEMALYCGYDNVSDYLRDVIKKGI